MQKIRLSIIIPMYNSQDFIERCIHSCLSQDLSQDEYEIIVVNDGSTDDGSTIVKELISKNKNIKLISQENAGAGMARNIGMKNANGQYVIFVDSDDYINSNTLGSILDQCEKNNLDFCQYLMGDFMQNNNKPVFNYIPPFETNRVYSGEDLIINKGYLLASSCSAMYSLSFLKGNNLYFLSQTSSEDVAFVVKIDAFARRVMFYNTEVYIYKVRNNSRRHSTDFESIKKYTLNNIRNSYNVRQAIKVNKTLSIKAQEFLIKRSNSMLIGQLIELIKNKELNPFIEASVKLASELKIYPIKGSSLSFKSACLIPFLNCKWLLNRFASIK
jgi:glycosyltransferase involved in cell wall biosynthesis